MHGETRVIVVREQTKSSSSSDSIYTSPVSPQTPQKFTCARAKNLSITQLQQFEYFDTSSTKKLAIVPNEPLYIDGTVSTTTSETEESEEDAAGDAMRNQQSTNSNRNDNNNSEKIIFNNVSRVKKVDLPDLPLSRTSELRSRE